MIFHEAQPPLAVSKEAADGEAVHRAEPVTTFCSAFTTRKDDMLRFLRDAAVPFTNNEAERDGRMMKLRQKISGGFRSDQGADDFAVIRTLIATAKKQGWNISHTLTQSPDVLTARLRIA